MKKIKSEKLDLPATASQWLGSLPGPCVIEVEGHDKTRWRVASTLVHGNEPSGFFAAFHFLKSGQTPACNLAILISSVRAARQAPIFNHRYIPGEFDLNRRFGIRDCHDSVTELAEEISQYLQQRKPKVIVDLHNTSGTGPAFAVATSNAPEKQKIASVFTDTMVITKLVVGSLMEQDFGCPCVTIECGGANEQSSHKFAYQGLERFATIQDLTASHPQSLSIYRHPTRIETCSGISLGYTRGESQGDDYALQDVLREEAQCDHDITLTGDIEKYNYGLLKAGTAIALMRRKLEDSLCAYTDDGNDIITELFCCEENKLIARCDLKVFMATRRADIAISDCLFYAIRA